MAFAICIFIRVYIFIPVIYSICEDFDLDFTAMFACVGLWNCFFLILYSVTNLSKLMKFSTRYGLDKSMIQAK